MPYSIWSINKDCIIIDSLVIQPSWICERKCSNCYLQKIDRCKTVSADVLVGLFDSFINGPHRANQITISLNQISSRNKEDMARVIDFVEGISFILLRAKKTDTEIHFSFFDPSDLSDYCIKVPSLEPILLGKTNVISFSSLDTNICSHYSSIEWLNKCSKAKLNWNLMLNKIKNIGVMKAVAQDFDSVYYILEKFGNNKYPPPPVLNNVETITDACAVRLSGQRCSANVSRFTVWPDGSVSGCPYYSPDYSISGETVDEVIENIVDCSSRDDVLDCPLE